MVTRVQRGMEGGYRGEGTGGIEGGYRGGTGRRVWVRGYGKVGKVTVGKVWRSTHKAVHTQSGLWPPQESCYLRRVRGLAPASSEASEAS